MDAALRLIATEGWAAATMEGIARECGIAKPVVYGAFANREELLRALIAREERSAFENLEEAAAAASSPDPRQAVSRWIDTMVAAVRARPHSWAVLVMPVPDTPPDVGVRIEQGRAVVLDQIRALVSRIVDAGGLPADFDIDLTSEMMLAVAERFAVQVIRRPDEYTAARITAFIDSLIELLLS